VYESKFDNQSGPGTPRRVDVIRDRLRKAVAGRAHVVGLATVGILGLGLAGVSAAVTNNGDNATPVAASASSDAQARTDEAGRADRAARPPAAATAAPATGTAPVTPPKAVVPAPAAKPAPAPKKPKPAPAWVSPMPGARLTSCYGMRWGVLHAGVDFAKPANTPEYAVGAGTVIAAGWTYSGYGSSVMIDHHNGYFTHYAHQNKTVVRVGQKVKAGQLIGYEGSTGDSTGPHLHFEVHRGSLWNQIDPAPWLRAHGVRLGGC
jgi:murein DD-endopeptidase MepM/ murein hydrolase activator NlpD